MYLYSSCIITLLCMCAQSCPTLRDPMDCTHQAPLSMGFSRQEHWSGLPFPSPEDLPDPGIKPQLSFITGRFFTTEPPGKTKLCFYSPKFSMSFWYTFLRDDITDISSSFQKGTTVSYRKFQSPIAQFFNPDMRIHPQKSNYDTSLREKM